MDDERRQRIQELFDNAAHLEAAAAAEFIRQNCPEDLEVQSRVFALLDAHRHSAMLGDIHIADVFSESDGDKRESESVPFERCGEYRLVRRLGRGGMGEVYFALREDGNRVAVKILHDRFKDTLEFRNRFVRETTALGRLQHPYIGTLHNAGVASERPWFAMDYIEGEPLDEYLKNSRLNLRDRLALFRKVCEAVQHAHKRLVIHCDLKPGNILVERGGRPRLVDFGIARLLDNPAYQPDVTGGGHRPYTLEYASPEQLRHQPLETPTDIYSLGVVLYWLITGRVPFENLSSRSAADVERVVCTEPPVRPSAAILAAKPVGWKDLDALCLSALQKAPGDRCSLETLIGDIDNYLESKPLKVRPVSRVQRISKFVRRNRTAVAASASAAFVLMSIVSFYNLRLARERDAATRERDNAVAEAARTSRTVQFLKNLFEGGDQEFGPAKDIKVVTILDRGAKELESLRRDPTIQAELSETLGYVYQQLAVYDRADSLLGKARDLRQSAFGTDSSPVAQSLMTLSSLRFDQSKYADSETLARQALDIDRRRLPADDPALGAAMFALAHVLEQTGKFPEALKLAEDSVRIRSLPGASGGDLSDSLSVLAKIHFDRGEYQLSDDLMQKNLRLDTGLHGEGHPNVANDQVYLAFGQMEQGRYQEAEPYLRKALAIKEAWYGKEHPQHAMTATFLAQDLNHLKRYQEAQDLLTPALVILERTYGKVHESVATPIGELAYAAEGMGRFKDAIRLNIEALDIYRKLYGENHSSVGIGLENVGNAYFKAKQYALAEGYIRQAIAQFIRINLAEGVDACAARIGLAKTLLAEHRPKEAEAPALEAWQIMSKQNSPSVYWVGQARETLADIYEASKEPERARQFRAKP